MPSHQRAPYDEWVNMLLSGTPGKRVVEKMREYYEDAAQQTAETLSARLKEEKDPKKREALQERIARASDGPNECTLRTKVSDIKKAVLLAVPKKGQHNTHPTYEAYKNKLKDAGKKSHSSECAAAVKDFLNLDLQQQAKELQMRDSPKSTEGRISLCDRIKGGGDADVADAFAKLRVIPESLETFRIAQTEAESCRRTQNLRLLRKKKIVIKYVTKPLNHAKKILSEPKDAPIYAVIAALLFVCGRRTTELLNQRSEFMEISNYAYGCRFKGQLKCRPAVNKTAYVIPLLVPFSLFQAGLDVVQAWQGDVKGLSNKAVSVRYQGNLQNFLASNPFGGVSVTPHCLRAIYMRYVLIVFDWLDHRDKRVAKYILGHSSQHQADAYDHIEIINYTTLKKKFKIFTPLTEADMKRFEAIVAGGD